MAETRVNRLSALLWLALAGTGVELLIQSHATMQTLVLGVAAMTVAQLVTVPAPSGERLYLGVAAAVAIPFVVDDPLTTLAIYACGMAGAWLLFFVFRLVDRIEMNSEFIAEVVSLGAFAAVFLPVADYIGALGPDAAEFSGGNGFRALVAVAAGGLAWYLLRALLRALVGLERDDLSVRYLWLLGLEDWSVILSLFVTGVLFGLAQPTMGLWALPVAALPYAFSHLAFVRYYATRVTYGQTIRALAQIPEVAGLAPRGHATRTGALALDIGRELGLRPHDVEQLGYAAFMHDIGRITLNEPAILRAGYTDEDIARWGAQIIAEAPYLTEVSTIVRQQHQRYRSVGQEKDPELRLASKIIKVASAYDQAVHELGMNPVDALEQIHRGSAYEFDPDVTGSLRRVLVFKGEIPA
jgi:hypothetical protein